MALMRDRVISVDVGKKTISRRASKWAVDLGYSMSDLKEYFTDINIEFSKGVEKLVRFWYLGIPCTYSIKYRRSPKDITNQKFGRLTVIKMDGIYCKCKCACGNKHTALKSELLRNDVRSCGCGMRDQQEAFRQSMVKGKRLPCRKLTFNGKTLAISEWANQPEVIALGIKRKNIYNRLRRDWPMDTILTTPCKRHDE